MKQIEDNRYLEIYLQTYVWCEMDIKILCKTLRHLNYL